MINFLNYKECPKNNVVLKYINLQELKLIEPDLDCHSALLSDSTGIIDVHDLMLNFIIDIEKIMER